MREYHKKALCHPDRRHAAKGLCVQCYIEKYPKAKAATCHPDRLNIHDGLCRVCYDRFLKERDPEYAARQRHNSDTWSAAHPQRLNENRKAYNRRNPFAGARFSRNSTLAKFDLTTDDEAAILASQGGGCGICGGPSGRTNFDIDHHHETGEVRGLLCGRCNKGLGLFGDDIESLERALAFLRDPPAAKILSCKRAINPIGS